MKRILIAFIAVALSVTTVSAQTGWVDHKGDNRISVKFPKEPSEVTPGSFASSDPDSTVYVFTIVDFVQVAGVDSVALAPVKTTSEFTGQLKSGISQSLPDVTFEDFKIGTWKGFTSYTSTGVDSKKKIYDMWMVLIGNKMYSFSTIRKNSIGAGSRNTFFNSVLLSN